MLKFRSAAKFVAPCFVAVISCPPTVLAQPSGNSGAVIPPISVLLSSDAASANPTANNASLVDTQREIDDLLAAGLKSGHLTRAEADRAGAELANIRAQQNELASRDNGVNATDADFLQGRLRQLKRSLGQPPHIAGGNAFEPALGISLSAEVPGPLICDTKRVLLAVGRDHAVAAVQRYGSANVALIVEAVASPYERTDTMTLHVAGGGLNAKIDGARDGAYLVASTTANFSLKSKHTAKITADVTSANGALPQYVKIWGSCSTR